MSSCNDTTSLPDGCQRIASQSGTPRTSKSITFDCFLIGLQCQLAYSLVWSVASAILPGCQRKYHPALDMGFDCLGWLLSFAAGAALLVWSLRDAYSIDSCSLPSDVQACMNAESALSSTEKSGAILLLLTGYVPSLFRRAKLTEMQYDPSRHVCTCLYCCFSSQKEVCAVSKFLDASGEGIQPQYRDRAAWPEHNKLRYSRETSTTESRWGR